MTELARSFQGGSGRKGKWNKQVVYSVYEVPVQTGDTIIIDRVSASDARAQAINLALDKGNLRANGVLMGTAAVWTHTSPTTCQLEVVGRKARSIDVWNGWSFEGVESAWLGQSAMVVEENGTEYTFRCSDGLGEPTFDDLVFELRIDHG